MKLQHTPGPWVISGHDIHDRETRFDDSGARVGTTPNAIAQVYLVPVGCRESNASLIAAAPELLEALETLLPLAIHTSPQDVAVHQARAAILKAKGE